MGQYNDKPKAKTLEAEEWAQGVASPHVPQFKQYVV